MSKGGRNLIILGIGSVLIGVITCGISLYLYHTSGDVYIDRSRPGFLPEQSETEEEKEDTNKYTFSENGNISNEIIDEYLNNLQTEINKLNKVSEPFSETPLTDKALGISK